ncbi:RluA family pseudouridine synthase [Streptomyces sp. NBC_01387]|uniref:RluA family pseudouridine synthase n=1 Tax=unclassified Streptomyces TaxID=2593676 RepID=UPI00202479AF|nr:RluA family pseudouridine synthase [Streptomyces sp. A 4/2]WSV57357.1 RluA family pseudouridine synthase [Streptomyces sp. NBC_01014]
MRRKTSRPPAPLPQREGIDPVRLRLPLDGAWATVRDHLVERLPGGAAAVDAMLREGAFVGADGPVGAATPYAPGTSVWFHRDFPDEVPVPYPIDVRYRDDHILVADKPHFLATTPRGSHVTQTALARLRHDLGLPALSPAHRLDRLTAGLVLFCVRPGERGAYQTLFRDRKVRKEYEAVAPYRPALVLPHTSRSRIEKVPGIVAAFETPGEPNSETRVELLAHTGGLGRYRLTPVTGRTHQLRVHMNALGVPLLGDPFYPVVTDPPPDDFTRPLQLLSRVLEFTDPVTGKEHRFESGRTLLAWTSYEEWAAGRP